MRKYEILLVDDDSVVLHGTRRGLEQKGYAVTTAANGEAAVELLGQRAFDLVISDLVMGEVDGIDVLKYAKERHGEIAVIILTGFGEMTSAVDALRLKADDYLTKPCDVAEIHRRASSCLEKLELRRKLVSYEKILPICCSCKKIRDDSGCEPGSGPWISVERYFWEKAMVAASSTYCPECARKALDQLRPAP